MAAPQKLVVTTTNHIEGVRVTRYLGLVRGIVVRSTGIGRGFVGGLRSLVGGNVKVFEDVCEEARAHAFDRLMEHARELGADGVIGIAYDATEFSQGVTEVLAYGTAVNLAPES